MSIESVVIVGTGGAPGLLGALAEARITAHACRPDEVPECDLALTFGPPDGAGARTRIQLIERRVNPGAMVAYSGPVPVATIASALRRPAQFVGLRWTLGTLEILPTDLTAPGVVASLGSLTVSQGRPPLVQAEQIVVRETG